MGTRYGVAPTLLLAVSIAETQMGKILGECEVSTVVDDTQLRALKKIARYTGRSLAEFKGSYAGAMGYMQIMPTTFYEYGQDGDGDGIKDPLNSYDSLATAAYYLARKIAESKSAQAALMNYNSSTEYCQKVLKIYTELELESKIASASR
jgi:membrane-bound lytic murein transglycosylase B